MKNKFYNSWKRKTKLEEEAIKALEIARKIILKNIPKEEIVSIYVKGSFIRREMNKKSDVDTITVVKSSRSLKNLKALEKKYRDAYSPQIQFSGYSLWEMKNNKRTKSGKRLRAAPSRMIQHLDNYELIYGKNLNSKDFYSPERGHLRGTIKAFRELFFPMYKENKIGFSELVKQVFWLVEDEQRWDGKKPPHSWKKLAKSIKDKDHIIHDTLRFRLKPTKDKVERKKFISKLESYLNKLEKKIK